MSWPRAGRLPLRSRFPRARLRPADESFLHASSPADHHPIPNLPPPEGQPRSVLRPGLDLDDPAVPREELVRTLADTLRRLQRIRTTTG